MHTLPSHPFRNPFTSLTKFILMDSIKIILQKFYMKILIYLQDRMMYKLKAKI